MFDKLLKTKDRRLVAIYMLATLLLYGAFWFCWYLMDGAMAISIGVVLGIFGISILLVRTAAEEENAKEKKGKYEVAVFSRVPKFPFLPFITIVLLNIGIGFLIASFFLFREIEPSRFFGLVLIIMFGYKTIQLLLGEFILRVLKSKLTFYIMITLCVIAEFVAMICVGVWAWNDAPLLWQVFFVLVLCVFYSFGQIHIRHKPKKQFWDQAAMAYLGGFIWVLLIVIILLSKGEALNGADFVGVGGNTKNKKKATINDLLE